MAVAVAGVVVGMAAEAACLTGLGDAVRVVRSGARPDLARAGAEALAAGGASVLVSFGIAGALVSGLAPGHLLLPEAVALPGGGSIAVDRRWRETALARLGEVNGGRLAGSDLPVTSAAAKAALARATGAVAVDMESHVVAAVARARGLPFLVLRAVADPAERGIPAPALAGLGPDGETRPWAVALRLLAAPWTLPALLRLARDSEAGLAALGAAVARLGPGAFLAG